MKKPIALALAAALSLSVAGATLAANNNPFIDVPASHWAYDALKQLQKDGVITGYGDGTFRGDRTLTRYEMATIIAQITGDITGKDSVLVNKLKAEFATELYNLGVRVDALEKNASTIKFTGDATVAYETGMIIGGEQTRTKDDNGNSSQFKQAINISMEANISDNLNFYGRLKGESVSNAYKTDEDNDAAKTSQVGSLVYDLAEFRWNNKNFTASMGRLNPFLGQGLLWGGDNPADGVMFGYNFGKATLEAGYLDLEPTADSGRSVNAFVANVGVEVNDKINFSAAYLGAINSGNFTDVIPEYGYAFNQWAVGANAKLSDDFTIIGEYVKNTKAPNDSQSKGAWARLQWKEIDEEEKGTYSVYLDYLKLGNWAVDSSTFGHDLSVAGGNGIGADGAKGWGLGFQYVFAKNANLELNYYKLKSFNGEVDYKDSYSLSTNFYF